MGKKIKKKLLLTFDYELFLGRKSGGVNQCMIKPTEQILQILKRYQIRDAIFFIDTTYLNKLEHYSHYFLRANSDFQNIVTQIKKIVNEGHYVFPHIHPHWIDARYESRLNEWKLDDLTKYRFHNLSSIKREYVFHNSISLLKEIVQEVSPGYEIDSFRAGGWSIQPFKDFKHLFEKYEIRNDFSVVPGHRMITNAQFYDYINVLNQEIYTFNNDVTEIRENGVFNEIPISVINIPLYRTYLSRLYQKVNYKKRKKSIGNGIGAIPKVFKNEIRIDGRIKKIKENSGNEILSLDFIDKYKIGSYIRYIDKHSYIQFLSHPKMISNHGLKMFEEILKKVRGNYQVVTDFRTMIQYKEEAAHLTYMNKSAS